MHLNSFDMQSGYRCIPYVVSGKPNSALSFEDKKCAEIALDWLNDDCKNDRLQNNYIKYLKLNEMAIYSIVWDKEQGMPVMLSGAQPMSINCCRLFSRYYVFTNYRTQPSKTNMFDKIDNFETDLFHLNSLKNNFAFMFWSRDKGVSFFEKIKKVRPDVFAEWNVYPKEIELKWKDNWQGIFYTNTNMPEKYIEELSFYE